MSVRLTMKEAEFLFKHMKYDVRARKWKRKKHALRLFNEQFRIGKKPLSRPTVDKLIKLYPRGIVKKPKKLQPRYIERFEESETYERLRHWIHWTARKGSVLAAFYLLKQKDPADWTIDDMKMLKNDPIVHGKDNTLFSPVTKMIAPEHAVKLRTALYRIGNYEAIKGLKDVKKRPAGIRKTWWLQNKGIISMFQNTNLPDMLLFEVMELQCGGRPTPTLNLKVRDVKFEKVTDDRGIEHTILNIPMFESKKAIWVDRYFSKETADLVKRYIGDMQLKPNDRLFPNIKDTDHCTTLLKRIGKRANVELIVRKGAGAYILRHTYATQASEHDVSAEVIMDMGAWKTWSVVTDHYLFVRKEKKLREQLGLEIKVLNFGDWIKQFVPHWEKRYLEIRPVTIKA